MRRPHGKGEPQLGEQILDATHIIRRRRLPNPVISQYGYLLKNVPLHSWDALAEEEHSNSGNDSESPKLHTTVLFNRQPSLSSPQFVCLIDRAVSRDAHHCSFLHGHAVEVGLCLVAVGGQVSERVSQGKMTWLRLTQVRKVICRSCMMAFGSRRRLQCRVPEKL